jgi:hypothetical protein
MFKPVLCIFATVIFLTTSSFELHGSKSALAASKLMQKAAKAGRKSRSFRKRKVKIFGTDDRINPVPSKYRELSRTGGILSVKNTLCNAFCVGDEIAMTAAHCFLGKKGNAKQLNGFAKFRFNARAKTKRTSTYLRGNPENVMQNIAFLGSRHQHLNANKGREVYDWALFYLERAICSGRSVEFAEPSVAKSAGKRQFPLARVSFGASGFITRYFVSSCNAFSTIPGAPRNFIRRFIHRGVRDVWFSDCDAWKGASGSGVFWLAKSGPKLIGLHSGASWFFKHKRSKYQYASLVVASSAFYHSVMRARKETTLLFLHPVKRVLIQSFSLLNPRVCGGLTPVCMLTSIPCNNAQ